MKKSFFGKYCLYKLKGFRVLAIAAAVLNFAALVLPAVICYNAFAENIYYGNTCVYIDDIPMFIPFCAIAATTAMLVITPAISFKYYNSRAAMDTLGCLPLNYSERFCGDFLGGLAANLISFIPFSAIGTVVIAIMQNTLVKEIQARLWKEYKVEYIFESINDSFLKAYAGFVLLLFLGYIGTYAVSTFVTSCCGRVGSSILYSVIALIVPAGIVSTFGTSVLDGAVGVFAEREVENVLMAIAPTGLWLSTAMRLVHGFMYGNDDIFSTMTYIVNKPVCIVIALLVTAAFLVGAYFLGKHRKAERVDRDFVYNGAYHVISLALSAAIIGFYFIAYPENSSAYENGNIQHIVFSAAVGLVIYLVMELVHMRNFKKLPLSLLRYAALYAVCFGFLFAANKTCGFGIAKVLPDKDKILTVGIEGSFFYSPTNEAFYYRSENAINTIYSGHEKLIQNLGDLQNGNMLSLNYIMKDGSELYREYSSVNAEGKELIKAFSSEVKKNETSGGGLGFIDDPRYDKLIKIEYHNHSHKTNEFFNIRPEACGELVEALKYDMLNNYEALQFSSVGIVVFYYELNGVERKESYLLNEIFEGTLAVLEKNSIDAVLEAEEFRYYIRYSPDQGSETPVISSLSLELKNTDERASAKTVMKYISTKADVPPEERSERWNIDSGSRYYDYCVRKTDEDAMLKAILDVTAELSRLE